MWLQLGWCELRGAVEQLEPESERTKPAMGVFIELECAGEGRARGGGFAACRQTSDVTSAVVKQKEAPPLAGPLRLQLRTEAESG